MSTDAAAPAPTTAPSPIINLVELLATNLKLEKFAVHLTKRQVLFLQQTLNKNPEFFAGIQAQVEGIVKDREINAGDLPQIILMLANIYNTFSVEKAVKQVGLIPIIRFTFDTIMESGLLPISAAEAGLIQGIVDVSFALLEATPGLSEKVDAGCISCLGRFRR